MPDLLNCKELIARMVVMLEQESACLRRGEFSSLEAMATEKLILIAEIDTVLSKKNDNKFRNKIKTQITRLSRASEENGLLLQGIFNGTKAAQLSLHRLAQQAAEVGTYGRHGERHTLSGTELRTKKTV